RVVLRRAMKGILPETIRWRPGKANLSPNLRRGLLERERATLDELILERAGRVARLGEFIDLERLERWYRDLRSQPTASGAFDLYRVVTLALWLDGECAARKVAELPRATLG